MPRTFVEMHIGAVRSAAFLFTLVFLVIPAHSLLIQAQPSRTQPSATVKRCWTYPAVNIVENGVSLDSARVFLPEVEGRLEAVGISDGARIWNSDLGGEITSNVVAANSALFAASTARDPAGNVARSSVRSLSKETGITNWEADLPASERVYLNIAASVLVVVTNKGKAIGIDPANGSKRWESELGGIVTSPPHVRDGRVIIASEPGLVTILSTSDGSVTQKRPVQYRPTAVFLVDEESAAFGDERGNLIFFHIGNEKAIWKFKHGAGVSDITSVGETLLVSSADNFVYAIALTNGNVRWKKRQVERIFRPDVLSGGVIVLSLRAGGTSSLIEGDHGKLIDQIQLPASVSVNNDPVANGNFFVIPATDGVSAYALNGCGK